MPIASTAFSRAVTAFPIANGIYSFCCCSRLITGVTVQMNEPGTLILISAVIGFVGTVIYSVALIFLNHVYLPRHLPSAAKPGKLNFFFMLISCTAYFVLAMLYLLTVLKII